MIPKQISGVNIIPLIDIMLVLLVIVLTSATFIAQGHIPVVLPRAENSETLQNTIEYEFTISKDGKYFFGKESIEESELARLISTLQKDTPVVIRGDAKSQFERFVTLLDTFQSAGLTNITIITKQ